MDAEATLRALAHPGRRRVLQLVAGEARPSGALAEACGWTKPATSQHLKVLKDAGLIEVHKQGNRRLYRAREERLAELRAFLDDFWARRMDLLVAGRAKGQYLEVDPPARIVFTWGWTDPQTNLPPGRSLVEVDLTETDQGEGTRERGTP